MNWSGWLGLAIVLWMLVATVLLMLRLMRDIVLGKATDLDRNQGRDAIVSVIYARMMLNGQKETDLAKAMQCSAYRLNRILHGSASPTLAELHRMANYVGLGLQLAEPMSNTLPYPTKG